MPTLRFSCPTCCGGGECEGWSVGVLVYYDVSKITPRDPTVPDLPEPVPCVNGRVDVYNPQGTRVYGIELSCAELYTYFRMPEWMEKVRYTPTEIPTQLLVVNVACGSIIVNRDIGRGATFTWAAAAKTAIDPWGYLLEL